MARDNLKRRLAADLANAEAAAAATPEAMSQEKMFRKLQQPSTTEGKRTREAGDKKERSSYEERLRQKLMACRPTPASATTETDLCPDNFKCPITLVRMDDPVLLQQSGHTYERRALELALAHKPGHDPLTNATFAGEPVLTRNHALRGSIEQWKTQGMRLASTRDKNTPSAKREIDVYLALQFPSTSLDNLNGRQTFHSELQRAKDHIARMKEDEEFKVDMKDKDCTIWLSDGDARRVKSKMGAVGLLVWCSVGHDEAATGGRELRPETFVEAEAKPDVVVVLMKYGAEQVAKRLREAGVPNVVWMRKDPYAEGLGVLFRKHLLPLCRTFALAPNDVFFLNRDDIWTDAVVCSKSETSIRKVSDKKDGLEVKLVAPGWKTSTWLQSADVKNLKMDACDFLKLKELEKKVLDSLEEEGVHQHLILVRPSKNDCGRNSLIRAHERSRALVLGVCNKIAGNKESVVGGIHRISTNKDSKTVVSAIDSHQEDRAIIWIDVVGKLNSLALEKCLMGINKTDKEDAARNSVILMSSNSANAERLIELEDGSSQLLELDPNDSAAEIPLTHLRGTITMENVSKAIAIHDLGEALKQCLWSLHAVYATEYSDAIDIEIFRDGTDVLHCQVSVFDLAFLAEVRDLILDHARVKEELRSRMPSRYSAGPLRKDFDRIRFDPSQMAAMYEELMVKFDVLTPHQEKAMSECETVMTREGSVNIDGPGE